MSYEQFVTEMMEQVRSRVGEEVALSLRSTTKNNGHERRGITFSESGLSMAPTIYLEEFYEKYRRGERISSLAGELALMYSHVRREDSGVGEYLKNYEQIKGRIVYRLLNRKKNQELLRRAPHVEYLDLAIVFCVMMELEEAELCLSTMQILNGHLKWWNVTKEEVYRQAIYNTQRLLPYEFTALYRVIQEMLDVQDMEDEWERMESEENMFVLTNTRRNGGAAAILYPGRLEKIGKHFRDDFYILPSSIHEVILLPVRQAPEEVELATVVREVNLTQVSEEEYLSDHVYRYDRERDQVIQL